MLPGAATAVVVLTLALGNVGMGLNSDGVALLALKYTVLSDPVGVMDSWDYNDDSPCSWTGVICSGVHGDPWPRVVGLVLPASQLEGSIPDQLGSLQHLRHLDLSLNVLNGSLPPLLFNATELRILSLSSNKLSGVIPSSLGALPQLQHVNLSNNAFVGAIPVELTTAPALRFLSLSKNYFSGEVPAGFGTNSQHLEALDLSSNQLNGSLPSEIGTVRYLNLSSNRLSGPILPEVGQSIPENATLDLSYNNFSGPVPKIGAFLNQKPNSFFGNPGLCGYPLKILCSAPANVSNQANPATSTPAIAAIPETLPQQPTGEGSARTEGQMQESRHRNIGGLPLTKVAATMIASVAVLGLVCTFFIYRYQARRKDAETAAAATKFSGDEKKKKNTKEDGGRWCCARAEGKGSGNEEDDSASESTSSVSESEDEPREQKPGRLVTVDGESTELELERLLKASAYILGASGTGIVYKAVLENGTALAVRRIGESSAHRMSDFENRVRLLSKLRHTNLARLRGFYWSPEEKLLIYDYAPNGSLASFSHSRKQGSTLARLQWESRLRIARGVARGLAYLHEKKYVHGNLKPSNVLLGANMEPWIGDFGLDQLVQGKASNGSGSSTYFSGSKRSTHSQESLPPAGRTGSPLGGSTNYVSHYQAPEAQKALRPTRKWDVYSFGVLLLELISGRPLTEADLGLWEYGTRPEERNRAMKMVDPGIRSEMEVKEEVLLVCLRLGFACASLAPHRRPAMKEAVQVLERIPTSSSFLASSSSYFYY